MLINLTVPSYLVIAGVAPAFMGDMADQNGHKRWMEATVQRKIRSVGRVLEATYMFVDTGWVATASSTSDRTELA